MKCLAFVAFTLLFNNALVGGVSASDKRVSELDRFPGGRNLIITLHSPLKRYFDRLKENTVNYNNGNGCQVYDETYRICANSTLSTDRKTLTNRVYILSEDQIYQTFIIIHEGEDLNVTPENELLTFSFKARARKFTYEASGVTPFTIRIERMTEGEKAVFFYPPINYLIKAMHLDDGVLARKKYLSSCVFCSGPEWFEVRGLRRPGLPDDIKFYNSIEPESITPRDFDSLLSNQFFRPLSRLGASLPRELVQQANLPDLKF